MTQKISSIDYEGLISCAKGEMFGKGNPQLPMPPMLMMDRISEISSEGGSEGKGHVIAEYDIKPDLWFFECHFINDPVMPGEVKFTGMVTPEIKLVTYEINFTRIIDRRLKLALADGLMYADGVEIYSAKDLKVGLFTEWKINFFYKI